MVERVQELGKLNVLDKIYAESGNITIDYIINLKLQALANKGVRISCEINVPNDIEIAPFYLSTILGNLIDNASEALDYVSDERWFNIKISYQVGFLMIQVAKATIKPKAHQVDVFLVLYKVFIVLIIIIQN